MTRPTALRVVTPLPAPADPAGEFVQMVNRRHALTLELAQLNLAIRARKPAMHAMIDMWGMNDEALARELERRFPRGGAQ